LSKKLLFLPFQCCPLKDNFPNNKMCYSIARHKYTLEESQWTARTIPWRRNTLAYLRVKIKLKMACSMWPSNEKIFWMQWICHGFILSGLYYKNFTVVNDASRVSYQWVMSQFGASLTIINYTPRVINYAVRMFSHAPKEHL
jgi:hypothetical protein